jgi:hypothetical protein
MTHSRIPPECQALGSSAVAVAATAALLASCVVERRIRPAPTMGVAVAWAAHACGAPQSDRDIDGVDDGCELALAHAFAPELIVDRLDCSWDESSQPLRLGGGYLFAVQRTPDGRAMRIAYLPAYFRDCGWQGLPCVTRRRECSAHAGDSEIIVVQARYDPPTGRWLTEALFLSAHCFGRSDGRCRWYAGDQLRHFTWVGGLRRGAARVWVAKGKHANYPSARECDSGHWYYDSCDDNRYAYRFPIRSSTQNIGSRRHPLPDRDAMAGCFTAEQLPFRSGDPQPQRAECFWDPRAPFRGWQRTDSDGTTTYDAVLRVGEF